MLTLIVAVAAFYFACLGLLGLTAPPLLVGFMSHWHSRAGLWLAFVIRLLFGLALWRVAELSRAPLLLQLLAVATLAGAVLLPLMGPLRFAALLSWWEHRSARTVRAWSLLAACSGLAIVWAVIA